MQAISLLVLSSRGRWIAAALLVALELLVLAVATMTDTADSTGSRLTTLVLFLGLAVTCGITAGLQRALTVTIAATTLASAGSALIAGGSFTSCPLNMSAASQDPRAPRGVATIPAPHTPVATLATTPPDAPLATPRGIAAITPPHTPHATPRGIAAIPTTIAADQTLTTCPAGGTPIEVEYGFLGGLVFGFIGGLFIAIPTAFGGAVGTLLRSRRATPLPPVSTDADTEPHHD